MQLIEKGSLAHTGELECNKFKPSIKIKLNMKINEKHIEIITIELEEMLKIHLHKQSENLLPGRSFFK